MKKPKRRINFSISLIFGILLHCSIVCAQNIENNELSVHLEIAGKVMDSTGKPLANHIVEVYNAADTVWHFIAVTKTTLPGEFRLYLTRKQLMEGTQESALTALKVKNEKGEVLFQRTLEPIEFIANQLFEIDIIISAQPAPEEYNLHTKTDVAALQPMDDQIELRNNLINEAFNYMGTPYKWAGSDPQGFDCSGFTSYVFRSKNINIPRTSREQQRMARPVPLEELLPGDLIFFSNGAHVDHVGIVVSTSAEDIEMVHASKTFGISVAGAKTNPYWQPRIHSGGSFLADVGLSPLSEEILADEISARAKVVSVEPRAVSKPRKKRSGVKMKYAIGLKAGTYGLGGEVVAALSPRILLRLGGTYMNLDMDINSETLGVKAENKLKTGSVALLASWQAGNKLYFSGGALYNMFENSITGSPDEGLDFGVLTIDPSQVEVLTVTMKPGNTISPYFGIGYGRVIAGNGVVAAALEVGGVYQAVPKLGLDTYGALTQNENQEQLMLLQEAVSDFKVLPVINFQISFKLN